MTPSIVPPSILAVVTVPRSAMVVPLKVEFFPTTICSLPVEVVNFIYESLPSIIFKASSRLSVKDILFLVVLPLKFIFNPAAASSTSTLSHPILPTFVIFPPLTFSDFTFVSPSESTVNPVQVMVPEVKSPPTFKFSCVLIPPTTFNAPEVEFVEDVLADISNTPAIEVLPFAEATVNLFVLISKSPLIPVAPTTSKVESRVVASSTFSVPLTVVITPDFEMFTTPPPVAREVAPLESNVDTLVSPALIFS